MGTTKNYGWTTTEQTDKIDVPTSINTPVEQIDASLKTVEDKADAASTAATEAGSKADAASEAASAASTAASEASSKADAASTAVAAKQDALTAGRAISIADNVVALALNATNGTGELSFVGNSTSENASNAYGVRATSFGYGCTASGENSFACGYVTRASGKNSHSEGDHTQATGDNSHAEGNGGTGSSSYGANGDYSHVEGSQTLASSNAAHAEGLLTSATDFAAHAEGRESVASGIASHAEGTAKAVATYSHAEGAGASYSRSGHAEGTSVANSTQENMDSIDVCHAEGELTEANGIASHSQGIHTKTSRKAQFVAGAYNIEDTGYRSSDDSGRHTYDRLGKYIEVMGNGWNENGGARDAEATTLSNARTLDWYGTEWLQNDVRCGGTDMEAATYSLSTLGATVATIPSTEYGYTDVLTVPAGSGVAATITFGSEKAEAPNMQCSVQDKGETMHKLTCCIGAVTTTTASVTVWNDSDTDTTAVVDWLAISGR